LSARADGTRVVESLSKALPRTAQWPSRMQSRIRVYTEYRDTSIFKRDSRKRVGEVTHARYLFAAVANLIVDGMS
jgi:hypothetical protein